MRRRSPTGVAAAAAAVALLLAGCSNSIAERSYPGVPDGSAPLDPHTVTRDGVELAELDLEPRVLWAGEGHLLAVSLWGSSSCPAEPTGLTQASRTSLKVDTATRPGLFGACTADLGVRTYEIRVPPTVATDAPVTVHVAGRDVTLPARRP